MEKSGTRLGRGKPTASEAPDVANKGAHASLGVLAIAIVREWRRASHGVLVVTDSERRAERLASVIYALDPASDALVFPRWDRLPYEHAPPSREVQGRRASVLRRLAAHEGRPLLLTTPDAILQRLPPRTVWTGATIALRSGDAVDPDTLAERLHTLSYADVPEVDEPGEAAFNGRVIDVFPAGALGPVRIEFEDDRIVAISSYGVATQRTTGALERVVLDAASELVGQRSPPNDEEEVSSGHQRSVDARTLREHKDDLRLHAAGCPHSRRRSRCQSRGLARACRGGEREVRLHLPPKRRLPRWRPSISRPPSGARRSRKRQARCRARRCCP